MTNETCAFKYPMPEGFNEVACPRPVRFRVRPIYSSYARREVCDWHVAAVLDRSGTWQVERLEG